MLLSIIEILFWILIGLQYLGVSFRYQSIIIGVCALLIGLVKLVSLL